MTPPLVSIVIPSFNHQEFVRQAIESVFNQTYRPLELIVIDDGSTDQSREVIQECVTQFVRDDFAFKFISRENRGAHSTINEGLNLASGEILTILNSDDFFSPERLSKLVPLLLRGHSHLAMSLVRGVDQDGKGLQSNDARYSWYHSCLAKRYDFPSLSCALLSLPLHVTTGNFVFTRELWNTVGEFADFHWCHDYQWLLRACLITEPILVSQTLMSYRLHGHNTISSMLVHSSRFLVEVAACFEDFFEAALTRHKLALPINRFSPSPFARRKTFIQGYLSKPFFPSQDRTLGAAISLCNRAVLNEDVQQIEMALKPFSSSRESALESLRCLRPHLYRDVLSFKRSNKKYLLNKKKPVFLKIPKSSVCLVTLPSVQLTEKKKYSHRLLLVGMFFKGRLNSVLRFIDSNKGTMSFAGVAYDISQETASPEISFAHLEYLNHDFVLQPIAGLPFPKHVRCIPLRRSELHVDAHYIAKERFQVNGWCQILGGLPDRIKVSVDNVDVSVSLTLMPRPDVQSRFVIPSQASIAGFAVSFERPTKAYKRIVLEAFQDSESVRIDISKYFKSSKRIKTNAD